MAVDSPTGELRYSAEQSPVLPTEQQLQLRLPPQLTHRPLSKKASFHGDVSAPTVETSTEASALRAGKGPDQSFEHPDWNSESSKIQSLIQAPQVPAPANKSIKKKDSIPTSESSTVSQASSERTTEIAQAYNPAIPQDSSIQTGSLTRVTGISDRLAASTPETLPTVFSDNILEREKNLEKKDSLEKGPPETESSETKHSLTEVSPVLNNQAELSKSEASIEKLSPLNNNAGDSVETAAPPELTSQENPSPEEPEISEEDLEELETLEQEALDSAVSSPDEQEVLNGGRSSNVEEEEEALLEEAAEQAVTPQPPAPEIFEASDTEEASTSDYDPDLGIIRLRERPLNVEEASPPAGDPDLGRIRLRETPLTKQPTRLKVPVYLVGSVGSIGNANTLAGIEPVGDRLFRNGISLTASPRLSRRTAIIGSINSNRYRYNELSRLDYSELRLQASLRHVIRPRLYGDLGWTHRQLFLKDSGDRFLYEHAAFATITRRDPITPKTNLTSFYNIRAGFADPDTSSRLRNTLGVSLSQKLTPSLQASVTGRMTLTNFLQQSRQDFYSQGLVQLSYKLSQNFRMSLFASLTRGNSSNRRVDFDNSTFGISLNSSIKLFE